MARGRKFSDAVQVPGDKRNETTGVPQFLWEFMSCASLSSSPVPLQFLAQFLSSSSPGASCSWSSSRVHLPVRVAVGVPHSVPLGVHELHLEFLAQFLPSSSPGSRFVGGGYWRRSRVVVGRSCSRSARVHERHGPAGTISPRASDHAGGRLGVEVESARLDDAFRKVATFIFFGVLCK